MSFGFRVVEIESTVRPSSGNFFHCFHGPKFVWWNCKVEVSIFSLGVTVSEKCIEFFSIDRVEYGRQLIGSKIQSLKATPSTHEYDTFLIPTVPEPKNPSLSFCQNFQSFDIFILNFDDSPILESGIDGSCFFVNTEILWGPKVWTG